MKTKLDIAYTAGLFDGEGYLGVNKQGAGYFLQVIIGQMDPSVLEWVLERWEGTLSQRPNGLWQWRAYSEKGRILLRDIQPFLIVKKTQVDYILRYSQPYREEQCLELRRLKKAFRSA